MSLFKSLGKIAINMFNEISPQGGASLKNAAQIAPDKMGCYKIYCDGLKYVGKAEYGLRHRFVQYYNGTSINYSSGRKIHENRDKITVNWVVCQTEADCRSLEAKWISDYEPKWNVQSGWSGY